MEMSKAQAPSIKYGQLSGLEIRILVLQPGSPEDPLVAELERIDLARYDKEPDYEADAYNLLPPQRIRTGPRPITPPQLGISHQSEEEAPPFEAISYVWGEPNFGRDLFTVDGHHVGITESLFEALVHLRYRDKSRRLWADAICINQQDAAERASQVAIMGRIYKSCAKVQVCLDIHSSPDLLTPSQETFVFAVIHHCAIIYKARSWRDTLNLDIVAALAEALRKEPYCKCCGRRNDPEYLTPESAEQGLRMACSLLGHIWFTRVWVVQEVALATVAEVRHGWHSVSWQAFQETISRVSRLELSNKSHAGRKFDLTQRAEDLHTLNMYRLNYTRDAFKPDNFITSLATFAGRECRDTRDRIYAVRALHGLEQEGLLKPDYECSDAMVYRDTVLLCLSRMPDLSNQIPRVAVLLALSSTQPIEELSVGSKLAPSSPPWVPDLGSLKPRNGNQHTLQKIATYRWPLGHQFTGVYRNLSYPFQYRWADSKPDVLTVHGRCIGVIKEKLLGPLPSRVDWSKMSSPTRKRYCHDLVGWIMSFRSIVSTAIPSLPAHLVNLDVRELLCSGDYGTGTGDGGIDVDNFARLLDEDDDDSKDAAASVSLADELDVADWWRILRLFLAEKPRPFEFQRVLCSVEMGAIPNVSTSQVRIRYGWASSRACVGDKLLYIAGAPFLFVQHESGSLKGRLAGDAWVQGIDESKILQPLDNLDWIDLE